jgi:hypothetical protein
MSMQNHELDSKAYDYVQFALILHGRVIIASCLVLEMRLSG